MVYRLVKACERQSDEDGENIAKAAGPPDTAARSGEGGSSSASMAADPAPEASAPVLAGVASRKRKRPNAKKGARSAKEAGGEEEQEADDGW